MLSRKEIFIEPKKNTGDLYFRYFLELPDEKDMEKLNKKITSDIFDKIKEKVDKEILILLSYTNFYGEAETYMASKGIPYSKEVRVLYSKAIYKEFSEALPEMIQYSEEENTIYISPFIFSLEFGDFYRPAVAFISTIINDWLEEISKD